MFWKTSRRSIPLDRPLVMGILNVTPDSFSDGGRYSDLDLALQRAEAMIGEGVDIIDIGGESTRPGGAIVDSQIELERTLPVAAAITKRFDVPVSIDTTKYEVAKAVLDNGAEIINDISGLRWDARLAEVAADSGAGLVVMHSRGEFESMHSQPPVDDILGEVISGLATSISTSAKYGVKPEQVVLDIGLGFGKTLEQNLELLAHLDRIANEFKAFPILVGASRKSFIGRLLGNVPTEDRLSGSISAAAVAVMNGARILRVHDVAATVQAVKVAWAIRET